MTWKTPLVLTLTATLACCGAPAAASELKLHGAPISGTVDVYRLAAPAIEPVVEPEQQPPEEELPAEEERHSLWPIGMMIGGAVGCGIAAGLVFGPSGSESDEFPAACGLLGAAGGVAGALVMIAVR